MLYRWPWLLWGVSVGAFTDVNDPCHEKHTSILLAVQVPSQALSRARGKELIYPFAVRLHHRLFLALAKKNSSILLTVQAP